MDKAQSESLWPNDMKMFIESSLPEIFQGPRDVPA